MVGTDAEFCATHFPSPLAPHPTASQSAATLSQGRQIGKRWDGGQGVRARTGRARTCLLLPSALWDPIYLLQIAQHLPSVARGHAMSQPTSACIRVLVSLLKGSLPVLHGCALYYTVLVCTTLLISLLKRRRLHHCTSFFTEGVAARATRWCAVLHGPLSVLHC